MSAEQDLANANVQIANLIGEVTRFRDAAMGINNIWPTITEGRNNTADGKYFSVPGGGAYMRLYRRQGSSASLIAEFPDRAELNSVIDQLGPLLGRGVVGGSGDLIAQGFAGLGGPVSYTGRDDFFTVPQGGVCNNSTTNVPANPPVPGLVRYGGMKFGGINAELLLLANGSSAAREIYANVKTAAGWEAEYRRMLSNRDILGTVSQSGGVPTGAIIERGSNANGEYIKFADGTMFCMKAYTSSQGLACNTPDGSLFRSSQTINWQFPNSFNTAPHVWSSVRTGGAVWAKGRPLGASSGEVILLSTNAFTSTVSVEVAAMGRWY